MGQRGTDRVSKGSEGNQFHSFTASGREIGHSYLACVEANETLRVDTLLREPFFEVQPTTPHLHYFDTLWRAISPPLSFLRCTCRAETQCTCIHVRHQEVHNVARKSFDRETGVTMMLWLLLLAACEVTMYGLIICRAACGLWRQPPTTLRLHQRTTPHLLLRRSLVFGNFLSAYSGLASLDSLCRPPTTMHLCMDATFNNGCVWCGVVWRGVVWCVLIVQIVWFLGAVNFLVVGLSLDCTSQ